MKKGSKFWKMENKHIQPKQNNIYLGKKPLLDMSFMETNSYIFCKHHMLFSKVNCTSSTHNILQLIWGLWKWIPVFSKYLYLVELNCIVSTLIFPYEITNWLMKWVSSCHWSFNVSICFLIMLMDHHMYIIFFTFRQPID